MLNITVSALDSANCNLGGYQYAGPGIVYTGATYACNNNPKNRLAGQCILSLHDGVEQCNNDPDCGGFEITTNLPWHTQFDVPSLIAVQLFKKDTAPDANSEWAPYLKLDGK